MNIETDYWQAICSAMEMLGERPETIFLGQSVVYPGVNVNKTLPDLPYQKLEMPVAENMQLGLSIGLALTGRLPVCIFPRFNFVLSAADQIVNHLDKLDAVSRGGYRPKVIIRTAVGCTRPVDPQEQHLGNFSDAFRLMTRNVNVMECHTAQDVEQNYRNAMNHSQSSIVVEFTSKYFRLSPEK